MTDSTHTTDDSGLTSMQLALFYVYMERARRAMLDAAANRPIETHHEE